MIITEVSIVFVSLGSAMAIDVPRFVLIGGIWREAFISIHGKLRMVISTSLSQHPDTVSGSTHVILTSWRGCDFDLNGWSGAAESHTTCVGIFIHRRVRHLVPSMDIRVSIDEHLSIVISTI